MEAVQNQPIGPVSRTQLGSLTGVFSTAEFTGDSEDGRAFGAEAFSDFLRAHGERKNHTAACVLPCLRQR
jgi:hypothetical protein